MIHNLAEPMHIKLECMTPLSGVEVLVSTVATTIFLFLAAGCGGSRAAIELSSGAAVVLLVGCVVSIASHIFGTVMCHLE